MLYVDLCKARMFGKTCRKVTFINVNVVKIRGQCQRRNLHNLRANFYNLAIRVIITLSARKKATRTFGAVHK